jgi:predicted nucleic acid-binding protein
VTDYFLDASAVVKRYADEAGSAWVRQITDPQAQNTILLAEITLAEVTAALAAKQRAPKGFPRSTDPDRGAPIGRIVIFRRR